MREARAAYRAIPSHLLTSVAAGPWIRLYSFQSLRVLERAASGRHLAAVVRNDCRGPRCGGARGAHAARGGRDAPAFRHGLLDLLLAPARSCLRSTISSSSSSCSRSSRRVTRASQTPRRDSPRIRRQPPAFQLTNASLGSAALLAVEARDRPGEHRGRPDQAARARRRLAHARVARAETPGRLPRPRHSRRLGRRTARRSTRCRSCARPQPEAGRRCGAKASSTKAAGGTFAVGAALDDPAQGATLQKLGLQLARIGVTWPAGATAPDPSVVAALQRLPAGLGSVLELTAAPLPLDDAGRAALAQYAAALAQQTPGLRSLVLAPAPTTTTAGDYALAFDQIRTAVQTVLPDVQLGVRIDGALAPKATLTALGPLSPRPRRLPSRASCGQRAVDDRGAPTIDHGSVSRERQRAADPARWTAARERCFDLGARLRRASRRRPSRPAEPGDARGRSGLGHGPARGARMSGRRNPGRAHRARVSGRLPRFPSRCSSAATSTASTSSRSTAPTGSRSSRAAAHSVAARLRQRSRCRRQSSQRARTASGCASSPRSTRAR